MRSSRIYRRGAYLFLVLGFIELSWPTLRTLYLGGSYYAFRITISTVGLWLASYLLLRKSRSLEMVEAARDEGFDL